jgi:hypothetical protein
MIYLHNGSGNRIGVGPFVNDMFTYSTASDIGNVICSYGNGTDMYAISHETNYSFLDSAGYNRNGVATGRCHVFFNVGGSSLTSTQSLGAHLWQDTIVNCDRPICVSNIPAPQGFGDTHNPFGSFDPTWSNERISYPALDTVSTGSVQGHYQLPAGRAVDFNFYRSDTSGTFVYVGSHALSAADNTGAGTFNAPFGAAVGQALYAVTVDSNGSSSEFSGPVYGHSAITANAGPDHVVPASGSSANVTLDGAGSTDPDAPGDGGLYYAWSEGSTVYSSLSDHNASPTLNVSLPIGVHVITLKVAAGQATPATDTVTIEVKTGNHAPVAAAGSDQTVTVAHDGNPATNTADVTVDASGSSDPDAGQVLTYEWKNQANAVVGSTPQVALSLTPGAYTFTVTVTDPLGEHSSSSVHVNVQPEPNATPTVNAGADMLGNANNSGQATFTLNATASDPDNDAVDVRWYEGATEVGTGATLTKTFTAGSHTLTVKATDPYGAVGSDTVVVSVQYSGAFFNQPINNDGSSIFKQGSTVPVKFTLTGASAGANITAHIFIAKVTNSIVGTEMEPVSNAHADDGNLFRSGGGGQWIFNMNTKNLTPGTYQIRADLGDGAIHSVLISLKP